MVDFCVFRGGHEQAGNRYHRHRIDRNARLCAGSSSAIRTGWTAGGGVEWLFDQHWSAKIEYQFVDLGTETVRVTAVAVSVPGTTLSSFNAAFRDQFNVVRVGLNYRY